VAPDKETQDMILGILLIITADVKAVKEGAGLNAMKKLDRIERMLDTAMHSMGAVKLRDMPQNPAIYVANGEAL
jgi:hypothetical protein